jgi:hypothetical protein
MPPVPAIEVIYDPNSLAAVLSRLELNGQTCLQTVKDLAMKQEKSHAELNVRLDEQDRQLAALKTESILRDKQVKWAVAIIAAVGWAINAFISWKRSS